MSGWHTITGKRSPPKSWGTHLHCKLRCGRTDPYSKPWPVKTTNWIHDGSNGDVVAVKREDEI
jgi:hypothetical protein